MYSITFLVMGRGEFPLDMLRYDRCFPTDTGGAHLIADCFGEEANDRDRTISLRATVANKHWQPTAARWNSFGWGVIRVEDPLKVS